MAAESWAIAENAWALACIEATAAGLDAAAANACGLEA